MLSVGVLIRLIKIVKERRQLNVHFPEAAILFLAISGAVGATLLFAKGNPWSAGKVMSFFAVLIPILMARWLIRENTKPMANTRSLLLYKTLAAAVFSWVAMNALFAGTRIMHAAKETDFGRYIGGHGEYRRVSADEIARIPVFDCPRYSRVAVFDPSVWGREFRTHLVEGKGFFATTPPYSRMRSNDPGSNAATVDFDCIFANTNYFDSSTFVHSKFATEIFTASSSDDYVALSDMSGGYGVELDRATSRWFAFAGNQDIELSLVGRTQKFEVLLQLCPGNSRKAEEALTIFVDIDGKRSHEFGLTQCAEKTIKVIGGNAGFVRKLRLTSSDPRLEPTLIGADLRDLRLRVEVIKVNLHDSQH